MKSIIASVILCFIVLVSLAYAQNRAPAQSQGRFTVAVSSDGGVAWRLDTVTGAINYCLVGLERDATGRAERQPGCSAWMR